MKGKTMDSLLREINLWATECDALRRKVDGMYFLLSVSVAFNLLLGTALVLTWVM